MAGPLLSKRMPLGRKTMRPLMVRVTAAISREAGRESWRGDFGGREVFVGDALLARGEAIDEAWHTPSA